MRTPAGAQGRNSTALSTEILIIHLQRFRKAKQPDGAAVVTVHEAERIVKGLFILMTGIQYIMWRN